METEHCEACCTPRAPKSGKAVQPEPKIFFPENAEAGCLSCQLIVLTSKYFYPKSKFPKLMLFREGGYENTATFRIHDPEEETILPISYYVRSWREESFISKLVGKFFESVYVSRDLEEIPSGESSLEQVRAWDALCRSHHASCWPSSFESVLPTRVIDLGAETGSCFLLEPLEKWGKYITLSHCWGKKEILTTKRETLERHKRQIDVNLLPKTFQDAINVTRRLGIRYLWIDSLCIIQDDPDDWARESAKMASIYRNSYLTIAATGAGDGSEGLFKAREVQAFLLEIPALPYLDQPATLIARRGRKHNCLQAMRSDKLEMRDSEPLMERGWVYQERLLSRRVLHFASDEMIWECRESNECECDLLSREQIMLRRRGLDDNRYVSNRSIFEEITTPEKRHNTAFETQRWYELISNYTSLKITKDEDHLPAFSGIASAIVNAEDYMAGVRKNHVVEDLLWHTSTDARRSQSYLGPTWSWASIIGGVGHHDTTITTASHGYSQIVPNSKPWVEVVDIFSTTSTVDPFGKVERAELRVRGYCLPARLLEKDGIPSWIRPYWGAHRLRLKVPSVPEAMERSFFFTIDTAEDAETAVSSRISLLLVRTDETTACFLILAECSDSAESASPRRFRRIGTATWHPIPRREAGLIPGSVKDVLRYSGAKFAELVIV